MPSLHSGYEIATRSVKIDRAMLPEISTYHKSRELANALNKGIISQTQNNNAPTSDHQQSSYLNGSTANS